MDVRAIAILGSRISARDAGLAIGCCKADGGHGQVIPRAYPPEPVGKTRDQDAERF
jgi:hypothetical protein